MEQNENESIYQLSKEAEGHSIKRNLLDGQAHLFKPDLELSVGFLDSKLLFPPESG